MAPAWARTGFCTKTSREPMGKERLTEPGRTTNRHAVHRWQRHAQAGSKFPARLSATLGAPELPVQLISPLQGRRPNSNNPAAHTVNTQCSSGDFRSALHCMQVQRPQHRLRSDSNTTDSSTSLSCRQSDCTQPLAPQPGYAASFKLKQHEPACAQSLARSFPYTHPQTRPNRQEQESWLPGC